MHYSFEPIGYFHAQAHYKNDAPRQGVLAGENTGVIQLRQDMGLEQSTRALEGFGRLWVLFVFHHNLNNWKALVTPPRHTRQKVGVFACRAPYRPNPIGISCLEIVAVKPLEIVVANHDLLDGTPILDIKPYLPYADAFPDAAAGWTAQEEEHYQVVFSSKAQEQLQWLEEQGVSCLREFIRQRLEYTPMDRRRNRLIIDDVTGESALAYRTWRALFTMDDHTVTIQRIFSGYTPQELQPNTLDRYSDKDIHRQFVRVFP